MQGSHMNEEIWTIESSKARNDFLAYIITAMGVALIVATRKQIELSQNAQAGFWLGILLLIIGILAIFYDENILVVVDPNQKKLRIQKTTRLGRRTSIIRFSEVERIYIATIGKRSSHLQSYLLKMHLKNGREESLGKLSFEKADIADIAEKLSAQIGIKTDAPTKRDRWSSSIKLFPAALGAVVVYIIYYRVSVGTFCSAMWAGSAPPVIISVAFFFLLGIFKRAN